MGWRARTVLWTVSLGGWLWVAAIFAAPAAVASSSPLLSMGALSIYAAGHGVCHQHSDRCFHVEGRAMPVCARCTGLYLSAAAAVPLALLAGSAAAPRRVRLVLIVAALPTFVTWSLEYAHVVHFSNVARFAASLPLGFSAAWLVIGLAKVE